MSNWTAASSDCSRPANNYVRVNTVDLYTPNARFTPERLGYQVLTLFGKLGYSHLYDFMNRSIAKIFTDRGHGSGFLITDDGFVATNHHVVRNSRYLAVQFAGGLKVEAQVAALSPKYDVAILKVNTSAVQGRQPLSLSTGEHESVRPGSPVVAFGSPLNQAFLITQGIISKVEEHALLGDFLLEPGNSGGPLVGRDGAVVGINTFVVGGIAGAVPVQVLRDVIADSNLSQYDEPDPSGEPLPVVEDRLPIELLKAKILEPSIDDDSYEIDAGQFTITAITPVHLGRLHIRRDLVQARNRLSRRGEKMDDPALALDAPFYEWARVAANWLDRTITFEVKPEFGSTAGSKWATAATAFAAGYVAGATRSPLLYVPPHQEIEFKAEFMDLRVYREEELLKPIHPGRRVTEFSFRNYDMTFIDEAYSGMYVYDPNDFMTGEWFTFEVYDAREPERVRKAVNVDFRSKLIRQLRADFAPDPLELLSSTDPGSAWQVAHDHRGGTFSRTCTGVLAIIDEMLLFRSENPHENWSMSISEVPDVARNRRVGQHMNAFHVIRSFNLTLVEDGQLGADPTELIAVIRAAVDRAAEGRSR